MRLPVFDVLPALTASLRARSNAVLIAPPGAGKTTAVAPALLSEPWCDGQILLLSPRRLAARAAAERMAELAGEPVGRTIGYSTRMDSRHSATTRILVLTDGIFRNRVQFDPELTGVSAVLLDEIHERGLDSDFGLALALDAQGGLRPDLRLLAMSATLDGARFAELMHAQIIESEGRAHPLTLRHIGRRAAARIEDEMAKAIRRALAEEDGDLLAFLPGVAEIERTAERLADVEAVVHMLHGGLEPAQQRAAIRKGPPRKIILATSIAETSLTIDGVRIVVDSGLARRARYDRAAGVTQLVTERASHAAVTQRAGRAARQGPGVAYRLWEKTATAGLPRFDPPEILEADLSPLLLDCAIWGVTDPLRLRWLDPPPKAGLAEARARLTELGALDASGRATPHGKAMAKLPMPPRLAHMLIAAGAQAAEVAVLLSERGLGGNDVGLEARLSRWRGERGNRADAARRLATRWARDLPATGPQLSVGQCIALAFPDRLARRRDPSGEHWHSAGGRGFRLDPAHPLAKAEWLAVADIQGAAQNARILAAAAIAWPEIEALYADRIRTGATLTFDPDTRAVRAQGGRRLGAIVLTKGASAPPAPAAIEAALIAGVREHGLAMLDWPDSALRLRARAAFAGIEAVNDQCLLEALDEWLPPLLQGKRRLGDIAPQALYDAMLGRLAWAERRKIDAIAPAEFRSPAGTSHAIDYAAEGGPRVQLRVQALFGLVDHPYVGADRVPLVLSLTSPAGRPIQTTRDLPGFWAGSWAEVAREMRGAYPKHHWPDDPTAAVASLKTKKALARRP